MSTFYLVYATNCQGEPSMYWTSELDKAESMFNAWCLTNRVCEIFVRTKAKP